MRDGTDLVNATREREAAAAALAEQQRRERIREEYIAPKRSASLLPDGERVSQETSRRIRAPIQHYDYPDPTIPYRTDSLASRYQPERQSSYQEATSRSNIRAPYAQSRTDGHSPRSSSRQVDNAVPITISNKPDRHQRRSEYGKSYDDDDVGSVHSASFGQGISVPRRGNHGTQDPSVAARDVSRWYDEDEFRDFLDWQEYKKLRQMADAERLPRLRRRVSGDSSSGDSPATQFSRISLGSATTAKAKSRHSKSISREGTTVSQNTRAYAPKEPARSSRRMLRVEEDSKSGDEVRERDSSPDNIIGHANLESDDETSDKASDTRVRMSRNTTRERHRDVRPDPLHNSKTASRDPATSTRHRSEYGADSRSHNVPNYDLATTKTSSSGRPAYADDEKRRPRSERERSYYDGIPKEKKRHPEPEAPYITSNSSRRRGERGYLPDSDRSY